MHIASIRRTHGSRNSLASALAGGGCESGWPGVGNWLPHYGEKLARPCRQLNYVSVIAACSARTRSENWRRTGGFAGLAARPLAKPDWRPRRNWRPPAAGVAWRSFPLRNPSQSLPPLARSLCFGWSLPPVYGEIRRRRQKSMYEAAAEVCRGETIGPAASLEQGPLPLSHRLPASGG